MWHATYKEKDWCQFIECVDQILQATHREDADRRLQIMCSMIVSIVTGRLGTKVQMVMGLNQLQVKISQLWQEHCLLRWQLEQAREEDNTSLAALCNIIRRKCTTL